MTKTIVQLPAGFTPATTPPKGPWFVRYEVLFKPSDTQSHFEHSPAYYFQEDEKGGWYTTKGEPMTSPDKEIIGWRSRTDLEIIGWQSPPDEMRIIRVEAPAL